MEFQSANPSVVKSIKQRDLLNTWLRIYAREQRLPRVEEYEPARFDEELPDLIYYTVESAYQPPRLMIQIGGTRTISAFGTPGKGQYLHEYLGSTLRPVILPVYYECLSRKRPVYTISNVDDAQGRAVAYERLLLPFGNDDEVNHVIASLKSISVEGGFEIKNLMRRDDAPPTTKLRTVIDRDLFHQTPDRRRAGDEIEFN